MTKLNTHLIGNKMIYLTKQPNSHIIVNLTLQHKNVQHGRFQTVNNITYDQSAQSLTQWLVICFQYRLAIKSLFMYNQNTPNH